MNENSKLQTLIINNWLADAKRQLIDAGIPSPHLDAEVLLAFTLKKSRTFIHAHPEQIICSKDYNLANSYLELRKNRMPIAYIIGQKEFYGRNFTVTSATLIPRPESEVIIEILAKIIPTLKSKIQNPSSTHNLQSTTYNLIDIGTGSGCLGITSKLEFPNLDVTLADVSTKALDMARLNAKALKAPVNIVQSDLFKNLHQKYDIILANLPYIDKRWKCSPEIVFEPSIALFADDFGEFIIKRLFNDIPAKLIDGGYLIIEADPRQHKDLIKYAKTKLLKKIAHSGYIMAFKLNLKDNLFNTVTK